MRIYVIGGPGSGKSSLADAIARRAGLSALHLDDRWDEAYARAADGTPTAAAIAFRERLVREQLGRPAWIIEGAEPPMLRAFADAADRIVWCDVPFRVAAFRMLRRHVLADLRGTNAFPGYRRLFRFLRSVARRYSAPFDANATEWAKWTRAYVEHAIAPYRAKTVRSGGGGDEREVERVIASLEGAR